MQSVALSNQARQLSDSTRRRANELVDYTLYVGCDDRNLLDGGEASGVAAEPHSDVDAKALALVVLVGLWNPK